ncbi:hypothetical protein I6A60_07105 [Frankia sp. AgB1.9]|uniref:hypothetical protein n=1 Tax=unclassified Frankia TaxID=2632575 RepID=UPI0019321FA9|nr:MULTISPECIES: hypothetical protein [unclassified Frankia]MBL7488410.1 hypothetical protein [Frankia sp. AgW1.1]MBL7547642.1 hypothetical protein [Frankia sp. AgB1.9]
MTTPRGYHLIVFFDKPVDEDNRKELMVHLSSTFHDRRIRFHLFDRTYDLDDLLVSEGHLMPMSDSTLGRARVSLIANKIILDHGIAAHAFVFRLPLG